MCCRLGGLLCPAAVALTLDKDDAVGEEGGVAAWGAMPGMRWCAAGTER